MTYLHFKMTTLSTVGKIVATKVEAGSTVRGGPVRLSHGLDLHGDGERLSDISDIYKLSQENFLSHCISSMNEREESVRTPNILV